MGLYNRLYLRGRYRASEFQVWDAVMGLVGVGEMDADVERNGTVRWRGSRLCGN